MLSVRTSATSVVTTAAGLLLGVLLTFAPITSAHAQSTSGGTMTPAAPAAPAAPPRAADPADVASIDAIVRALYESISGPKGAPRDFDRLRTLYGPNARMIVTGMGPDGKPRMRNWSVEEYITAAGPGLMENGFYEKEIGRRTDSFGNVWHIMSVYDSRYTPDSKPFARGINSIQLFKGADRWYIVNILWDSERPDNPIPADRITVKDRD